MGNELEQKPVNESKMSGRWNDFLACKGSDDKLVDISVDPTIQSEFRLRAIDKLLKCDSSTYKSGDGKNHTEYSGPELLNSKKWLSSLSMDNLKYAANQIINHLNYLHALVSRDLEVYNVRPAAVAYSRYLIDAIPFLDKSCAITATDSLYLDLDKPESSVISAFYLNEEIPVEYKKQLVKRIHGIIHKEDRSNTTMPGQRWTKKDYYFYTLSHAVDEKTTDEFLLSEIDALAENDPQFIERFPKEVPYRLLRKETGKHSVINYLEEKAQEEELDNLIELRTARKILFPKEETPELDERIKKSEAAQKTKHERDKQDEEKLNRQQVEAKAKQASALEKAINNLRKPL